MKAFSIILFFLVTGYAFGATKNDVLNCLVVQPANVVNPYVTIIYNNDYSESVLHDETYGASLKSKGFNTALFAARFTNEEGTEYDAFVGFTGLQYNEESHLINSEAQYVFPVDENTYYDVVFAPQEEAPEGDYMALFIYNSTDPVDAAPIAILSCNQGVLEIE